MQNGQQKEALDDFAAAILDDQENSDIYHHRGQVHSSNSLSALFFKLICKPCLSTLFLAGGHYALP